MAIKIDSDGTLTELKPTNGVVFTLEELQEIVGGYIERIGCEDGRIMWVDEEGNYKPLLKVNPKASKMVYGRIVGTVVIFSAEEARAFEEAKEDEEGGCEPDKPLPTLPINCECE